MVIKPNQICISLVMHMARTLYWMSVPTNLQAFLCISMQMVRMGNLVSLLV
jgi:hypothetical protein